MCCDSGSSVVENGDRFEKIGEKGRKKIYEGKHRDAPGRQGERSFLAGGPNNSNYLELRGRE